jgi:hypothetical protein
MDKKEWDLFRTFLMIGFMGTFDFMLNQHLEEAIVIGTEPTSRSESCRRRVITPS